MTPATLLGLFALAVLTLVPAMPMGWRLPGTDSGVFLYAGWRVLHGAIPYRDVWDHKPPLIFFLNAFGLAIGGGSEWGVWVLQLVFLLAACGLVVQLTRDKVGAPAAGAAALLMCMSTTFALTNGNLTEQYGLTFQLLFLRLSRRLGEDESPRWALALGACAACLFLLKQNLVALPLAWAARDVWIKRTRAVRPLLMATGGALIVFSVCAAFFAMHGALPDLWDQAFNYNAVNRNSGASTLATCIASGLRLILPSGLPILALFGCALALADVRRRTLDATTALCVLALPMEIVFAVGSGRAFEHYFLAWIPTMTILAARPLGLIVGRGRAVLAAVCCALSILPVRSWTHDVRSVWAARGRDGVVEILRGGTSQDKALFLWGAQARYNFMARRRAPTRLVYQYPIFRKGWRGDALARELRAALEKDPPAMILDSSCIEVDFPPLDRTARATWRLRRDDWVLPEALNEVFSLIDERYRAIWHLGPCIFYVPRGSPL